MVGDLGLGLPGVFLSPIMAAVSLSCKGLGACLRGTMRPSPGRGNCGLDQCPSTSRCEMLLLFCRWASDMVAFVLRSAPESLYGPCAVADISISTFLDRSGDPGEVSRVYKGRRMSETMRPCSTSGSRVEDSGMAKVVLGVR